MRVLVIDNLDLFTYNLVDELEKKECEVLVYRNDTDMKIISLLIQKFGRLNQTIQIFNGRNSAKI